MPASVGVYGSEVYGLFAAAWSSTATVDVYDGVSTRLAATQSVAAVSAVGAVVNGPYSLNSMSPSVPSGTSEPRVAVSLIVPSGRVAVSVASVASVAPSGGSGVPGSGVSSSQG